MLSVDSLVDPTSTCKRRETLNQEVAYIAKLEDITGPRRPSEERAKVLVDADSSDTLLEERRTNTDQDAKPRRWSQSECDLIFICPAYTE